MRTIKFNKKWKRIGSGAFSHYYQMSKRRGIKLMHDQFDPSYAYCRPYIKDQVSEAKLELKYLKRASLTKHAPKGYEVVLVKEKNGEVSVGIIMEHIDAVRVARLGFRARDKFEAECGGHLTIEEIVRNTLLTVGVYHDDLHTGNILAKTKNGKITSIYAIDFTPECIHFTKRQKVVFK